MTGTGQFTESPTLTAVAIAYRNPAFSLIADEVLPRVSAPALNFKWQSYNEAAAFTLPDTRVGRRSVPNKIEIEGGEVSSSCENYAIDIPLDNDTIDEAVRNGHDPKSQAAEQATGIIELSREVRVAQLLQDTANYHSSHVQAMSGSSVFTNPDSDPISVIERMMADCWQTPNQLTFGHAAWLALRSHPKVVKAAHGNSGDQGRASIEQVAALLEVKKILVGSSRVNIKRPGVNPEVHRVWNDVVTGQFIDSSANTSGGVTFGFTAQYKNRVAGTLDVDMAIRGGVLVRSGETLKELIVANRAGFLLQNVAPSS